MNNKDIRFLKWSLKIYHWWLNVLSVITAYILFPKDGSQGLELIKNNTGDFLLKSFTSHDMFISILLCVLTFSYTTSISSHPKNFNNSHQWIFNMLFFFILGGVTLMTLSQIDRYFNPFPNTFKFVYLINFIILSLLTIHIRNHRDKILSTLDKQP
jgi:hypothetical protein